MQTITIAGVATVTSHGQQIERRARLVIHTTASGSVDSIQVLETDTDKLVGHSVDFRPDTTWQSW